MLNATVTEYGVCVCVCIWVEVDCISGPDSEDLLRDSSEHLGGAPPSGPHWSVLTADGESSVLMFSGFKHAKTPPGWRDTFTRTNA